MSSNNGTPASTAGGETLSPSNQSRFVVLRSSPSRSASKTEDAVDTNVNPPKDSALSNNATDEYIGSIIDGSKVSSSNVILATSSLDGKSTTEYEILDKSLEIEDLNLGEEEKKDDTNQGNGVADNMKAKDIDGDVAMLDYMSPSEDGEDEDVGEDTKQVSAESDDEVSTSSPTVNDRPSHTDRFKFNKFSFFVAPIKVVFSFVVSVIAIIGRMTLLFALSSLGAAVEYCLQMLLKDTNVAAASTEEETAHGASAPATGVASSLPSAGSTVTSQPKASTSMVPAPEAPAPTASFGFGGGAASSFPSVGGTKPAFSSAGATESKPPAGYGTTTAPLAYWQIPIGTISGSNALGSTPAAAAASASPSPFAFGASAGTNAFGNPTSGSSSGQSAPAPGADDFGGRTPKEILTDLAKWDEFYKNCLLFGKPFGN